jgi:hypothetical protein
MIVFFWLASIAPMFLKIFLHNDIYHDSPSLLIFIGVLVIIFIYFKLKAKFIYKDYNKKFDSIKSQLKEIEEFENEM